MSNYEDNFRVTRIKDYDEVSWLKDMPVAMVNKYWMEMSPELLEHLEIGLEVVDNNKEPAGKVLKIDEEKSMFLIELYDYLNYTNLISTGIPIENIIFDLGQNFSLGSSIIDTNDDKKVKNNDVD